MQLRRATAADSKSVLALNEESVQFLSPLNHGKLSHLVGQSALYLVAEEQGAVVAFLLALREGAQYDSSNYLWFASRYKQFLYIDRVVVSKALTAKGAGSLLYSELFRFAASRGVPRIACEFDIDPPNTPSERFHAKFGFQEVGRQRIAGGTKLVSLQTAAVTSL